MTQHRRQAFTSRVSGYIWENKYRRAGADGAPEASIEETWRRVARAAAAAESDSRSWEERFYGILRDFTFLPGGRILAGAGTGLNVTLFNCFVMGTIEDDLTGIFEHLKEGAVTMQAGGGVGYDFSTLRPRGSPARTSGNIASGPVSFMRIWNAMCETLLSSGARRGAMMATLRCDHPDIEAFIDAKRESGELTHFNLSVLVTDAFMEAVDNDGDWPLVFPADSLNHEPGGETVLRHWPGFDGPVPCLVLDRRPARELWRRIMRSTYEAAEPGVLFVDRINEQNNLGYCEYITCTNPCGEIPLPPYGACNLGSLNMTGFVRRPFTGEAEVDMAAVRETAAVATRFLDDVIDISRFPLDKQARAERKSRRIGLGITGLADALIMLGLHYGSPEAREQATRIMVEICHTAYRTSTELALEKGAFPLYRREDYLEQPFIKKLPEDIRDAIRTHGIRNSHLTAIAPTGTISLLADNVSGGIEPVFDFTLTRKILDRRGRFKEFELQDYALRQWHAMAGESARPPDQFVTTRTLAPQDHLLMQAALQPFVDNAVSKTINVPADFPFEDFKDLYAFAWRHGLKGCTTFRPSPERGEVLSRGEETSPACCSPLSEREQ